MKADTTAERSAALKGPPHENNRPPRASVSLREPHEHVCQDAWTMRRPDSGRVVIAALIFFSQRIEGVCLMSTFVKPDDRSIWRIASIVGSDENSYLRPASRPSPGKKLTSGYFS